MDKYSCDSLDWTRGHTAVGCNGVRLIHSPEESPEGKGMTIHIPLLALVLSLAQCTVTFGEEHSADLFVSPVGNDQWSGRLQAPNAEKSDGPFASWERARDEIRSWKLTEKIPSHGVIVEVHPGTYSRADALTFNDSDSGSADRPHVWRAEPGAEVRIVGGVELNDWTVVTDPLVLDRLDPSVHGKVVQVDLKSLGITDFGDVDSNRMELLFDDRPMKVARYPNEGLMEIAEVLGPTPREIHGVKGKVEGIIAYSGDRPARWINEPDGWLHGYWFWDWADERKKIAKLDPDTKTITLATPHHHYGYRKGQWFYAFNMLSELDTPGEWYLDRTSGKLFFYPPTVTEGRPVPMAMVSLASRLLTVQNASHLVFQGLTLEAARSTGIVVTDSNDIRVTDCTLRNFGETAVHFDGGHHNTLSDCVIHHIGRGAVVATGGDRKSLTPSEHVIENCDITAYGQWKPMYSAGISVNGVGIHVRKNHIHDAPHMAILFRGNDHLLEFNEIHHVCLESNDAGAIYSGRDWTWRGTKIRHNYLHHITGFRNKGCLGVYLDDMLCGTEVTGNLFYRVKNAVAICGGRDCLVESNVFVECEPALHVDDRALNWADYHALEWIKEAREKGTVMGIAYDKPPYSTRYPELARMMQEDPAAPRGNVISKNIQWGGTWADLGLKDPTVLKLEQNRLNEDPHFDATQPARFPMSEDSPVYQQGFEKIPLQAIGPRSRRLKTSH